MTRKIRRIRAAAIRHWSDTGQIVAYIDWTDERGQYGCTSGRPDSAHIQALIARAVREGVVVRQESGCVLSPVDMRI